MEYEATLKSALEYAKNKMIEDWIHLYLNSEGNNISFSDGLKLEKRYYIGPAIFPITMFSRCCGPEDNMKWIIPKEGFDSRVNNIYDRYIKGWDMPPLIINFADNKFELNDGNHRYEALVKSGQTTCNAIIWTTGTRDRDIFVENYMQHKK
jgi:hypothetical protein